MPGLPSYEHEARVLRDSKVPGLWPLLALLSNAGSDALGPVAAAGAHEIRHTER